MGEDDSNHAVDGDSATEARYEATWTSNDFRILRLVVHLEPLNYTVGEVCGGAVGDKLGGIDILKVKQF